MASPGRHTQVEVTAGRAQTRVEQIAEVILKVVTSLYVFLFRSGLGGTAEGFLTAAVCALRFFVCLCLVVRPWLFVSLGLVRSWLFAPLGLVRSWLLVPFGLTLADVNENTDARPRHRPRQGPIRVLTRWAQRCLEKVGEVICQVVGFIFAILYSAGHKHTAQAFLGVGCYVFDVMDWLGLIDVDENPGARPRRQPRRRPRQKVVTEVPVRWAQSWFNKVGEALCQVVGFIYAILYSAGLHHTGQAFLGVVVYAFDVMDWLGLTDVEENPGARPRRQPRQKLTKVLARWAWAPFEYVAGVLTGWVRSLLKQVIGAMFGAVTTIYIILYSSGAGNTAQRFFRIAAYPFDVIGQLVLVKTGANVKKSRPRQKPTEPTTKVLAKWTRTALAHVTRMVGNVVFVSFFAVFLAFFIMAGWTRTVIGHVAAMVVGVVFLACSIMARWAWTSFQRVFRVIGGRLLRNLREAFYWARSLRRRLVRWVRLLPRRLIRWVRSLFLRLIGWLFGTLRRRFGPNEDTGHGNDDNDESDDRVMRTGGDECPYCFPSSGSETAESGEYWSEPKTPPSASRDHDDDIDSRVMRTGGGSSPSCAPWSDCDTVVSGEYSRDRTSPKRSVSGDSPPPVTYLREEPRYVSPYSSPSPRGSPLSLPNYMVHGAVAPRRRRSTTTATAPALGRLINSTPNVQRSRGQGQQQQEDPVPREDSFTELYARHAAVLMERRRQYLEREERERQERQRQAADVEDAAKRGSRWCSWIFREETQRRVWEWQTRVEEAAAFVIPRPWGT
ncbi:hypothetical protein VTJ49DRAFT_6973 [Mycothermus thermophilus]|uniref:Uncharacterized protein n=1 Tax=Humicola insolens TaxID=85995 RepID=A0ABR3V0L9_HUMIN